MKSEYLENSKAYKHYPYDVLAPDMISYLHNRTLEMFKQVRDIFDKNDIPYMICGGTLLGAIGGGMVTLYRGMMISIYASSRKISIER